MKIQVFHDAYIVYKPPEQKKLSLWEGLIDYWLLFADLLPFFPKPCELSTQNNPFVRLGGRRTILKQPHVKNILTNIMNNCPLRTLKKFTKVLVHVVQLFVTQQVSASLTSFLETHLKLCLIDKPFGIQQVLFKSKKLSWQKTNSFTGYTLLNFEHNVDFFQKPFASFGLKPC